MLIRIKQIGVVMQQPVESEPCTRCGLAVNFGSLVCHHCNEVNSLGAVFLRGNYKGQVYKLNKELRQVFVVWACLSGVIVFWLFIIQKSAM